RGRRPGPAAAAAAADGVAVPGTGRAHAPVPDRGRRPGRRVRGVHVGRPPHDRRGQLGTGRDRRGRHDPGDPAQPAVARVRLAGAEPRRGHRLLVVADRAAPGDERAAGRRVRQRGRRRVNLITHRRHLGLLAGLGLLAEPDGGRPGGAYDEAAPGWYVGEAVGALLLRRAGTAARDGDPVHGILETSWSAHAGGTGRFGAPGPEPLTASLRRMMDGAGLDPATVSYVEGAAAGAGLADAAEFAAFAELLADHGRPVPLGTLKPNVGHSEGAS